MSSNASEILITNGCLVTPDGVVDGALRVSDGLIECVGSKPTKPAERRIDAEGMVVLPGLVDLHGDDIEDHRFPRDEAQLAPEVALRAVDRMNLAAGITTKFHALPFEDDPDKNRSPAAAAELAGVIDAGTDLTIDHHINARCRVSELSAVRTVERVIDRYAVGIVAIGASERGKGQFPDRESFVEWYSSNDGNRRSADLTAEKAREYVTRHPEAVDGTLTDRIERIARRTQEVDAVLSSHDDESATEVEGLHSHGAEIAEYPVTLEAARRATNLDMTTIMGAPNLLQDGSVFGNLDASLAIDEGLLDVLCVDYYPPAMIASVFVETGEPLHQRVARVTSNPADAVGLSDRGRLESGKRGDVIIVDPNPYPTVEYAIVRGHLVLRSGVLS